jgi:hypothetical protein
MLSTNDVLVDPETGDTHVLARTQAGAVAYFHRAARATGYDAPVAVVSNALRARLVLLASGAIAIVYGRNGSGLFYRMLPAGRTAGQPFALAMAGEVAVPLPAGYETIDAIYPEAAIYERTPPAELHLALVGDARQNEVLHVALTP